MPDGTKKRVHRKIVVFKVPKGDDDKKSPIGEEQVHHEEVDIDEANPDDEKYDPKVNKKLLNLIWRKNALEKNNFNLTARNKHSDHLWFNFFCLGMGDCWKDIAWWNQEASST